MCGTCSAGTWGGGLPCETANRCEPVTSNILQSCRRMPGLVRLRAFGCIPLGGQWIFISRTDSDSGTSRGFYQIRDDGCGDIATKWDHQITIRRTPDGHAQYTDRVKVCAGLLTPVIWLYAHIFYRYRQYRLRRLVKNGFLYDY